MHEYKGFEIITDFKVIRLKFLGHFNRMGSNKVTKIAKLHKMERGI